MSNKLYLHIAEIVNGFLHHGQQADFDKAVLGKHTLVTGKQRSQLFHSLRRIMTTEKNGIKRQHRTHSVFLNQTIIDYDSAVWILLKYDKLHIESNRYDYPNYRYYALDNGDRHVDACFALEFSSANTFTAVEIAVFKNGDYYKTLDYIASIDDKFFLNGSCNIYMNCGDYIDIRFKHIVLMPNGHITLMPYGYFDIHYAGCNRVEKDSNVPVFTG